MLRPPNETLIVIPALNEEGSVGAVVREIFESIPNAAILVVDDGSTDHTTVRAIEAGARVATLPYNLGVGGAMRLGFRLAVEEGFSNVVQIDADGQHDPSRVEEMIAMLDHFDLVLGARFAGEGDYQVRGARRWAMQFFSSVLSRTTRTSLTDTTSGFRASGARAVAVFAEHYPAEYLGDTIEALVIASRCQLRIGQLPVSMRTRYDGNPSQSPIKAAAYLARASLALLFALMKPASAYDLRQTK